MQLNDAQKEAVNFKDGALAVIACPGAGKTGCIVERINKLLEGGISPEEILAVTFTNKAANEMKERLTNKGHSVSKMWVMTFHKACVQILRKVAKVEGYSDSFNIYDDREQKSAIKHSLADLEIIKDDPLHDIKELQRIIEFQKNNLLDDEELIEEHGYLQDQINIIHRYHEILKENDALDFTDLLAVTNKIFNNHPQIRDYYSKRFKYVLIDEAQDTNLLQYKLIDHLCSYHKNIAIVSDEDQSVYEWRGALPGNVQKFIKDYSAKIVVLETNYRSTPEILKISENLINHNQNRIEKALNTPNDSIKNSVEFYELEDPSDEARFVANNISAIKSKLNISNKDISVIYRSNAQSREFESAFRNADIPYKLVGGFSFYERKEVKTCISYLKFLDNPKNMIAFSNCINEPKRGIGDVGVMKIIRTAQRTNKSIYDICKDPPKIKGMTKRAYEGMVNFSYSYNNVNWDNPTNYVRLVLEQSKYLEALYQQDQKDKTFRRDNAEELINSIEYWVSQQKSPKLSNYFQEIALLTSEDSEDNEDGVFLMTAHSSKGLEFPVVFLVGMEEGLLPHVKSLEERGPEEERRVCYVAATRAKKKLILTRSKSRFHRGELKRTVRSRFLIEAGVCSEQFEEIIE